MQASLTAADIMSTPVVSVAPATPVREVAATLRDRRIGGVPVTLGYHLAGIITDADLIHRHELGTASVPGDRPWWWRMHRSDAMAWAYVKAHGRAARHVMSGRVHQLAPSDCVAHVARLFDQHRIGRAPVVAGGRVVGIVARADLVRALAEQPCNDARARHADDEAIGRQLRAELSVQPWWNSCWETLYVVDGIVIFKGCVENGAQRMAACVAAENVAGVRGIRDDRTLRKHMPETL